MKKLMFIMLVALAILSVGAPTARAAQIVTGTVANIEIDEGFVAATVHTKDGRKVILQVDPGTVKDLQGGDQVQVSIEGSGGA